MVSVGTQNMRELGSSNLLSLVLWPHAWSVLERTMYAVVLGGSVLWVSAVHGLLVPLEINFIGTLLTYLMITFIVRNLYLYLVTSFTTLPSPTLSLQKTLFILFSFLFLIPISSPPLFPVPFEHLLPTFQ